MAIDSLEAVMLDMADDARRHSGMLMMPEWSYRLLLSKLKPSLFQIYEACWRAGVTVNGHAPLPAPPPSCQDSGKD